MDMSIIYIPLIGIILFILIINRESKGLSKFKKSRNRYRRPYYKTYRQKSTKTVSTNTDSEQDLVSRLIRYGIESNSIFNNIYIKKHNGTFSQVDVIAITQVGIIVFEVKEYSGWIFGKGQHRSWTQVLNYGNQKYYFYNPILQNQQHIINLKKLLSNETVPFYSVIVFYGDCQLKEITFVPQGTYITKGYRVTDVISEILDTNKEVEYNDKQNIINILQECAKNGESEEIQNSHVEQIQDMLGTKRVFE